MIRPLLVSCLFLFLCHYGATSQETKTRIGFGVSLNPTALFSTSTGSTLFLPIGFTNVYLPIDGGKGFRAEPEFGIYTSSSENSSGSSSSTSSSTIFRLGVGLFRTATVDTSFTTYVGPRIGILYVTSKSESGSSQPSESSETDYSIGLAIGGEYLLSQHFSLGGEVQLNYIKLGEPDVTPKQSSTLTRSMFTNNALIFFRWYY